MVADPAVAETGELAARMRRALQLDVDVAGLGAALEFDRALADDLAQHDAGRLLAGTSLYEDTVKGICGTNTTWRRAVTSIAGLASLDPDGAFPEPSALLGAGEDGLRTRGRAGYRAPFLLATARAAEDGTLAAIEERAPDLETPELAASLRELPGVGPSTAAFLCLLIGRHDLPLVDSAVRRVAARRWFGGRRPADHEVLARVSPAGQYAGLALYWATMRGWHEEGGLATADGR